MKICVSLHTLRMGGGVQQMRAVLVNEWASCGHDVTVVCPVEPSSSVTCLSDKIKVVFLGDWPDKQRYHFWRGVLPLCRFFKRQGEFDAVLASTTSHILLTALALVLSGNRSPLFGTLHVALDIAGGPKQIIVSLAGRIELWLASVRVKRLAGVSRGVSQQAQSILPFRREPVQVIYNPVISDKIYPQKDSFIDRSEFAEEGKKIILAVGRLHHQKGFDLLLDAFSRVKNSSVLLIVGEGEAREGLERQAEILGIAKNVRFLGYRSDVIGIMKVADCFVLSSRWEGLGNVLVEALCAQCHIVSFDCPHGPSEILEKGKWGKLVKNGNVIELARQIDEVLSWQGRNNNDRWKDFHAEYVAAQYLNFMDGHALPDNLKARA